MKLYFTPGACSLSPHIALREAGLPFDIDQVDLANKQTKSGTDFRTINPKGYVPALQLDDGQVLTEAAVIVQYIADRKPEAKLAPPAGTRERYVLQEWLNFIATELHKGLSPLFKPDVPEAWQQVVKDAIAARFDFLTKRLQGKPYVMGESFSVADGYLFTILNWTNFVKIDLGKWPTIKAYQERIAARPAVRAALKAEGLVN